MVRSEPNPLSGPNQIRRSVTTLTVYPNSIVYVPEESLENVFDEVKALLEKHTK